MWWTMLAAHGLVLPSSLAVPGQEGLWAPGGQLDPLEKHCL